MLHFISNYSCFLNDSFEVSNDKTRNRGRYLSERNSYVFVVRVMIKLSEVKGKFAVNTVHNKGCRQNFKNGFQVVATTGRWRGCVENNARGGADDVARQVAARALRSRLAGTLPLVSLEILCAFLEYQPQFSVPPFAATKQPTHDSPTTIFSWRM